MSIPRLTDHEVEMRLGYTPCVCGVIDGTWHPKCYKNKTSAEIKTAYKRAFNIARKHLLKEDELKTKEAINKAFGR